MRREEEWLVGCLYLPRPTLPNMSSRSHAMLEVCHARLPLFSLAPCPASPCLASSCTLVPLHTQIRSHHKSRLALCRPIAVPYQSDLSFSHVLPTWHRAATIAIESLEASQLASP
jgi:hypothetical protein